MSDAREFTDANFKSDVLNDPGVVLVDFWAPWCNPCRTLSPRIDALATEFADKVRVGKVNTDANPKLATDWNVMAIPTVLIFKAGQLVDKFVGITPRDILASALGRHLA